MRASTISLVLIAIIYGVSFCYFIPKEKDAIITGGDNFGYYAYLPALFIYHDIDNLKSSALVRDQYAGRTRDTTLPVTDLEVYFKGTTPIIKYTCGVAILEAPAFFAAGLVSCFFDQPMDGYSPVYIRAIQLWGMLFVLLGLYVLKYVLRHFFKEGITALLLFAIGVATNLYYFSVYNIGMSHGYLFSLYALLLFFTIRFHRQPSVLNGAGIGLAAGMITLIRPVEMICILIPLLYGIHSFASLREKFGNWISQRGAYVAAIAFGLCALPQVIYWKLLTGHLIYYSYGQEGFNFKHPEIWMGLTGFKNGWLPYTPVMLLAVPGLVLMWWRKSKFFWGALLFLTAHVYIIYSWWCWTYINGLGSRPMIEVYPLLAIPFGLTVNSIWRNIYARVGIVLFILLCAAHQLMMTYQKQLNIMWSEDATRTFYFQTLFKTKLNFNDLIVYDTNEQQPEQAKFQHLIYKNDFEDSTTANYQKGICGNGFSFVLDDQVQYSPTFERSLADCGLQPRDWVKISFDACNLPPIGSLYRYTAMVAEFNSGQTAYKYKTIRIQNKVTSDSTFGIWRFDTPASGKVYFFTRVPEKALPTDLLKVYGYNGSVTTEAIDNLTIEAWK